MDDLKINGQLYLTSKERAIREGKNKSIEYVNKQIQDANDAFRYIATLLKSRLYNELIDELKEKYEFREEGEKYLLISWKWDL